MSKMKQDLPICDVALVNRTLWEILSWRSVRETRLPPKWMGFAGKGPMFGRGCHVWAWLLDSQKANSSLCTGPLSCPRSLAYFVLVCSNVVAEATQSTIQPKVHARLGARAQCEISDIKHRVRLTFKWNDHGGRPWCIRLYVSDTKTRRRWSATGRLISFALERRNSFDQVHEHLTNPPTWTQRQAIMKR